MKTKYVLVIMITSFFLLYGCSNNGDSVEESEALSKNSSASKGAVISQTYPQAQAEVLATFDAIGQSIINGAGFGYDGEYMDELISYHAYGPKFVEFNHGKIYTSEENEHNERMFGEILEQGGVKKFDWVEGTMKVAVYFGNVANVTFASDFVLKPKGGSEFTVNDLITLLFVKTKGEWKMVHEHHSPAAEL